MKKSNKLLFVVGLIIIAALIAVVKLPKSNGDKELEAIIDEHNNLTAEIVEAIKNPSLEKIKKTQMSLDVKKDDFKNRLALIRKMDTSQFSETVKLKFNSCIRENVLKVDESLYDESDILVSNGELWKETKSLRINYKTIFE